MPRKNGNKPDVETGNIEFQGYIQHSLKKSEKEQFEKWEVDHADLWLSIDGVLDSGYTLSVKRDSYNNTFQASLMCRNANDDNCGWVLTARAPASYEAVALVFFKHFELLKTDWSAFHSRPQEDREYS